MQVSADRGTLASHFAHALASNFPGDTRVFENIQQVIDLALERTERCFRPITLPGYRRNGEPFFNHLHADQRAIFTYFAANSAFKIGDVELATRFFLLNKMQNGLVCMYDTALPEIFLLIHTVGMVLGKATYANYFVAYQNVTVGTEDRRSPVFGEHCVVYGGSMILGATELARGTVVSAQSVLIDEKIPEHSVVIGRSPGLLVKPRKRDFAIQYWDAAP